LQGSAQGITVPDHYQDRDPQFWDQGVCQSVRDETEVEVLIGLEIASRLRRQIQDHIPAIILLTSYQL